MSRGRALKAINLQATDTIPHYEHISNPDFQQRLTGIDPWEHPQLAEVEMIRKLDLDLAGVPLDDKPIPQELRFSGDEASKIDDEGKTMARWGATATWDWDHGKEFHSIEDVLAYEPLEYDDIDEEIFTVEAIKGHLERCRIMGEATLPVIGWYNTLIIWPITKFGWELFIEAAMLEPERFKRVLDDFGEISLKVFRAFARTEAPLVSAHDDICMARGPIFNPEWYRKYVYPWYERFWEPLHEAGKKVFFVSDGNIDAVVEDVIACGADGFACEPYTDLERLLKAHGQDKIVFGNIDTRILTSGSREDIYREVKRCADCGRDCPGYFFKVGNLVPWNVPPDNIQYYFDISHELGRR